MSDLVPGLTYIKDAIDVDKEETILDFINSNDYVDTPFHRKVQQYGYQYHYNTRSISDEATEIPDVLLELAEELKLPTPENIIVNRYLPGEGISPHIDLNAFGDTVASLTLGSGIQIDFKKGNDEKCLYLLPRSLFIMQDEARYKWTHGIVTRKSDYVSGKKIKRGTRVSITFRTVN